MSEQVRRRRSPPWIVLPVWLFILVVLYLASLGPVWGLYVHRKISVETFMRMYTTIYYPVKFVKSKFVVHPVVRAYDRYLDWWM